MKNPMLRLADLRMSYASYLRLGLGLSAVGLATQGAYADQTWDNTAGNQDWNAAANWTTDTFPNGTNAIILTGAAGQFPVISATPTTGTPTDIVVGRGTGVTARLDQTAGTAGTGNGNWIFVGQDGSNGTFNVANTAATGGTLTGYGQGSGSFTAGRLNIGAWSAPGSTGTMNINTSGTINANNGIGGNGDRSIDIGENGSTGTLNLDSGTVNATNAIWLGTGTGSVGTIKMSGGTINAGNTVRFGAGGGTGNAQITGGNFTQTGGEFWVGTSGPSTIDQSGGTVTTASYFVIGRDVGGTGTYNLTGGTVNAANTAGVATLGSTRGIAGTLAVSGTGTFNSNNGILVGEAFFAGNNTGSATGTVTVSGTGLISTSTNAANGIYLGVNANADGIVNLNGGTIQTAIVKKGAGTGTFNFNGGTLKATADNTGFMQGLTAANVQAGGAVVDSNSHAITIGQALLDGTGGGGLTKTGIGTLTLTGANTYTGTTQVNGGTLALSGSATSNVVVGNAGAFGGTGTTTGTATFNAGGTLLVDLSGFAPITAASFTFSGTNPVVFTGGNLDQGVTYDVVAVPSGGTITGMGNLVATARGTFATGTDKITFTAGGAGTRTWNTTNGNWDINGATNWLGGDQKFLNGDTVVFNNPTAASTVALVGSLLPASVTVTNTTNPYTFSGAGSLGGTTTLNKAGSGSLTLATANSYTGDTTLDAGTLNLANAGALGSSLLVINGGTLNNTSGGALALTNGIQQAWNGDFTFTGTNSLDMGNGAVSVGGSGTTRTVTVAANTLTVGEITATSQGLTKQGAGTLEVTSVGIGVGASVISGGPLNVAAGTVQINRTGAAIDGSGDFTVAGLTGSGTLTNGAAAERWFFSNPTEGAFNFSGILANGNTGALGFYKNGAGTQTLSGANTYTARTTVDGGGELVISGANSGTGTYTEILNGKLTLANNQSLGTDTLIRFFGVDVSTLDLAMDTTGTAYSITKGTGTNIAIVSNRATPGAGINHTLTTQTGANGIGGGTINVTSGANVTSGTGRVTFTQFGLGAGSVQTTTLNPTTANVTLGNVAKQNNDISQTLGLGGTSSDNQVTGVIANGAALTGANNVSVLKTGTSTWTLSGANTYTGTTTVSEGTLSIAQATLADTASVNVAAAGVLNLTHAATDTVDRFLIDGVEQASGTWGSLSSSATNKTARITGTGILLATNGTTSVSPFSNWATAIGLTSGNNAVGQNADSDSYDNGTEYILGGSPLNGANNPKIYSLIADSSDAGTEKELILTIAVPQGTPPFPAGSPTSSVTTTDGFGITVRGSANLAAFTTAVTPVDPVTTGLPAAPVQGGVTYEYRSFSLGGSNGLADKGFLQVTVTNP